eukprot:TRINITY_DN1495_c0_g1_i3.p1 TRINITY_DN1495_c0_g1~~TRINITY_DN1495_c0_g1_i3.p1  ORF type:complete len:541 (+),score=153.05 TRINITY_DN1495_c0_g1_i3:108-1730(+)
MSSQLRLKIGVDGSETRRFALDAPVNYIRLRELIENLLQVQDFSICYTDDEGEQITLASEADLKEAIAIMEDAKQKALKLFVLTTQKHQIGAKSNQEPTTVRAFEEKFAAEPASFEDEKLSFDDALSYLLMQFSSLNSPEAQSEIVELGIILQSTAAGLEHGELISWDMLLQQIQAQCQCIASLSCFREDKAKLFACLHVVAKFFGERVESGLLHPVPPHLESLMVAKSEQFVTLVSQMPGVPEDVKSLLQSFRSVVSKIESVGVQAQDEKKDDTVVHVGVQCDGCQMNPIVGNRYKCTACHNFDLCESCEAAGVHPVDHELIKFKTAFDVRRRRGFGRMFGGPHHGFRGHAHHGFGGPHEHHGFGGPHGHHHGHHGGFHGHHGGPHSFGAGYGGCQGGRRWRNSQCPWNKRLESGDAYSGKPCSGMKNEMGAQFIGHVNMEDGCRVGTGQMHVKTWSLRNDGKVDWDNTVRLVYVSGNREVLLDGQEQFEVPLLKSNETGDVNVPIVVPQAVGTYKTVFRLAKNGEQFGHYLWVEFSSQ